MSVPGNSGTFFSQPQNSSGSPTDKQKPEHKQDLDQVNKAKTALEAYGKKQHLKMKSDNQPESSFFSNFSFPYEINNKKWNLVRALTKLLDETKDVNQQLFLLRAASEQNNLMENADKHHDAFEMAQQNRIAGLPNFQETPFWKYPDNVSVFLIKEKSEHNKVKLEGYTKILQERAAALTTEYHEAKKEAAIEHIPHRIRINTWFAPTRPAIVNSELQECLYNLYEALADPMRPRVVIRQPEAVVSNKPPATPNCAL